VIADSLRSAGERVEVLTDHFDADAPDAEWLRAVGHEVGAGDRLGRVVAPFHHHVGLQMADQARPVSNAAR
jgi:hypothetical protein